MTIKEQKQALRKVMLSNRNGLKKDLKINYDNWICAELEKIIKSRNFKVVHSYIPFLTEINITPLLENFLRSDITLISPKTLPKRKLENRLLTSLDDLESGIMGTLHPKQSILYTGKLDLIIVPGLAFDNFKNRLGYGGGYYDNFLIEHPGSLKVGIFYPFQEVPAVPIESHDVPLDIILVKEL